MTLTIAYYQLTSATKRIIDAELKFEDFDKDPSKAGYTLNVVYYPRDYWELIVKFAFDNTVFIVSAHSRTLLVECPHYNSGKHLSPMGYDHSNAVSSNFIVFSIGKQWYPI